MDWDPVIRYIKEHARALNNNVVVKPGETAALNSIVFEAFNFIVFEYDDFTKEVKRRQSTHKIVGTTCMFVDDRLGGHYECWIVYKDKE